MTWDWAVMLGAPLVRAFAGWLTKALEDDFISQLEWKELVKTILTLGIPIVALYYGFNLDITLAAAIPILADYLYRYGKKLIEAEYDLE